MKTINQYFHDNTASKLPRGRGTRSRVHGGSMKTLVTSMTILPDQPGKTAKTQSIENYRLTRQARI
jgi:hypothetical protein